MDVIFLVFAIVIFTLYIGTAVRAEVAVRREEW